MAASRVVAVAPRRQPARPLPGATWQDHVVDANVVQAELDRLWARFGATAEPAPSPRRDGRDGADDGDPISVQMRATTFNLVAVGRRKDDAARIEDAILRLGDLYPSRATILIAGTDGGSAPDAGLDVRVSLVEQPAAKDRPAVRFECVTVAASGEDDRHLASIASPLLVADLPDFLWWPSDGFVGSELFDDMVDVTDRVILDTAVVADPATGLHHLAAMTGRTQACPNLSDFAWSRLAPWRQLVAQFFDPPATQPCLETLEEVTITYATPHGGRSGISAALLMAGWLASRLGWRAPGELVPAGDTPGDWRATLRSGGRGRLREVVLALRPTADPTAAGALGGITLKAGGGHAGSFRIERVDALGLWTRSEAPGMPPVSRMVYSTPPDDASLLADDLRVFGRDHVYEQALAFAATLAPEDAGAAARS